MSMAPVFPCAKSKNISKLTTPYPSSHHLPLSPCSTLTSFVRYSKTSPPFQGMSKM